MRLRERERDRERSYREDVIEEIEIGRGNGTTGEEESCHENQRSCIARSHLFFLSHRVVAML